MTEGREGKEGAGIGGRLPALAGAVPGFGVLHARVSAAIDAASCGAGGQGPASVELSADDARQLLNLANESLALRAELDDTRMRSGGDAVEQLSRLSAAVGKLLASCGAVKAGRGRPVSAAAALGELRAVWWQVSGKAEEVARRDAAAVSVLASAVPASVDPVTAGVLA